MYYAIHSIDYNNSNLFVFAINSQAIQLKDKQIKRHGHEIDSGRGIIGGCRDCASRDVDLADDRFPEGRVQGDVPERGMRKDR